MTSTINKTNIVAGLLGASLAFVLVLAGALSAQAATYTFSKNLSLGASSSDVKSLQMVLNSSADTMVSASGVGSAGSESMYFGAKTKAAVIKFQIKNSIKPASGFVGPITRGALNSMGATSMTPSTPSSSNPATTPTPGAALTVAAATQPANSLAPQSASRVPFTKITLSAGASDVSVSGVTVERSGLAQDAVFSGIVLLDENGIQIGISKTLNSNHQAVIGEPFTVKAGTSRTLTVAGNMGSSLSSYAGQVAGLNVVQINTAGTVSGSLPVMGAMHTINASLSLGTATAILSSFDPNSAQSKEIGTTNYKFTGIKLTAGSVEKVRVWSVRFNQSGSASSNDLANVMVNVDGTDYPTVISADGKYYTATFGSGVVIDKGFSKDVYIHADIIGSGSSGRTVEFDLYKNTDVYMTGETYGYGIIMTPSGNTASSATTASQFVTSDGTTSGTASTPFLSASTVTVSAGSVTSIAKATSVAAQNIAKNVNNQPLGGFVTDIKGEPISVQSLVFTVSTTSASTAPLTQITIVDENGTVVAGPIDQSLSSATLTFTDTITLPVGQKVYTVKGKLSSIFNNNDTVTVTATPASWTNITGQVTGNSISFSSLSSFAMNQMTVKAGSLAISVAPSPAAQTIVAGTVARTFANYNFDATQSGEDLRFSSLSLTLGGSGTATLLTSCQLFDGNTSLNTGSNVITQAGATNALTFDQSLVIPRGTTKSLALKCNIASSASGTYIWGVTTSSSNPTVTGSQSSSSITASGGTLTGQTMTIGSGGTLVASKHPSSPIYSIAAANTTGNTVGVINFRATNEDTRITKIGLSLTGAVGDLASNGAHVSIYDGSTLLGTVNFPTGSSVATTTSAFLGVTVPKDSDKTLTIKADLAEVGTGKTGTAGKLVSVDYNSAQATGADSGTTIEASGSTSFAGLRLQKSYPTLNYSTTSGTAQNGTNDLVSLTVSAPAAGSAQLNKLTFSVATTTATVSTFTFTGPNGNVSSSSPILNAAGTTVTVYFDSTSNTSDRTVSAGTTNTYTLRATDVSLTGTNSTGSVTLALKADTAYPTLVNSYLLASTTVSGLTAQNILWSPISTTSVSNLTTAYDDWTNGYGLPGCFASAGLGTNCAGRTISK